MRNSTSALGQNTSLGLVLIDSLDYHLNKQQTNYIFYSFTLTVLADKVRSQSKYFPPCGSCKWLGCYVLGKIAIGVAVEEFSQI